MEFWGEEVKAGVPAKVTPNEHSMLHLSQAVLGETKSNKGNETVLLSVKVDGKKFVIATLKPDSIPQWSFDLVFHKQFELSHNWKHGSVYFTGYHSEPLVESEDSDEDTDSEDEDLPLDIVENGKLEPKVQNAKQTGNAKANAGKPETSAKPSAKLSEPKKAVKPEDDSDDEDESDEDGSDEEDESDEEDDSEEGMSVDDDSADEDDDSESEEEETPKKAGGKKRANDSATKTPVPSKKAKSVTPQKTDGKKAPIVSTPHPAKNAGKAAADAKKTPKSGGQFSCGSCERAFGSDTALKSHSSAKHGAK